MIVCDKCREMGLLYKYSEGHICRECFLKEQVPTVEDFCSMQRQGWTTVAEEYLELWWPEIEKIINSDEELSAHCSRRGQTFNR
jgi:hypothetical protein